MQKQLSLSRITRFLLVASVLLTLLPTMVEQLVAPYVVYGQQAPNAPGEEGIFLPIMAPQSDELPSDGGDPRRPVLRQQTVHIRWLERGENAPLLATSAEQALGIADQRLQLNLFPDKSLTAQRQTVVPAPDGNGYHWIGHLVGVSNSLVYLVVKDQMVVGEIRLPDRLGVDGLIPGRVYQVRPQDNGLHVVREIGPRINPDSGSDFRLPPSDLRTIDGATDGAAQPSEGNSATTVQTDNGSTIDVLVAYTPAARQYVGSAAAVAMEVELAVGLTNQAYANSGINQRLQLVGLVEVAYTETTNMNTDLDRLTNKRDGYMDAIHTKRDEVGADLVALLLQVDSDIAGVGWLLKPMDASFEAYAFSVADICCIANDLVFAHELGHNMGAAHDWYVDDAAGAFDYSHGYVGPACSFKTIMAYGSECPWFNPIPYFSNPDLLVEGAAIGVRPGTNLGCRIGNLNNPPCDADNRLTLNNSALTVANFRQHVNPPAPTATPTVTPVPPMATATSTATPTARATTTTQPAATVTATALLPTPTGEPRDTATATPTAIVNPTTTPDPASTPTPTATPLSTCTPLPTSTPAALTPSLAIVDGPATGAPGSYFVIAGQNFRRNRRVTLLVNGRELTTLRSDDGGTFSVLLMTLPTTKPGKYSVIVDNAPTALTWFTIDARAPLVEPPVAGQAVTLPGDLAPEAQLYLPIVQAGGNSTRAAALGGAAPCQ